MATWTTIPNGDIDQDSPVTQPLITALRDNPVAIAEGASGAPKIEPGALRGPTGGSTYLIRRIQEVEYSYGADTYIPVGNHDRYSFSGHLGFTVLVAGTVRCYLEHATSSSGRVSEVRILKNGVSQASWQNTSTSFVARTLDLSVAVGDLVIYQQRLTFTFTGDASRWRNLRVYSDNTSIAVA